MNDMIDGKRLVESLHRLADFGRWETGVHRPCFSEVDIQSRQWLMQKMREAGLEPEIDGIGNVIGRSPGPGPKILLGSHTDTQPRGGWLDGAMGVMYGLEVAKARGGQGVDVASWADEEAHYKAFLGSRSFVGELTEAEIDEAKHREDGTPLREALKRGGLSDRQRALIDPSRYKGYIEAHIEQGGLLEKAGLHIGVVTAIVGIFQYLVTFEGQQNHAGTTPMALRKDAGVAMRRFCAAVDAAFETVVGPRSVWTMGKMQVFPGAPAIVPGRAEMILQFRDEKQEVMEAMEAAVMKLVEGGIAAPCTMKIETLARTLPTVMDPALVEAVEAAAKAQAPEQWMRMPSAAGHDAQIIAHRIPAAMLFVPSIGGISHHHTEHTDDADIILGARVLADAVESLLKG